jgi:Rrf2 family protein
MPARTATPISCFVSEIVDNAGVRISAKADYAVRAAVELASADGAVKGDQISQSQSIPLNFLENILIEMRHAGLVRSQRGREGGYWLARPADEISIADVVRAVEGPLAHVRGEPPEEVHYAGPAEALEHVWIAVRANLRAVLDAVSLADLAGGRLPGEVHALTRDPDAWLPR